MSVAPGEKTLHCSGNVGEQWETRSSLLHHQDYVLFCCFYVPPRKSANYNGAVFVRVYLLFFEQGFERRLCPFKDIPTCNPEECPPIGPCMAVSAKDFFRLKTSAIATCLI